MDEIAPRSGAYDFEPCPAPVCLHRGVAELVLDGRVFSASAEVLLKFLPDPAIIIRVVLKTTAEHALWLYFAHTEGISLALDGLDVKGFCICRRLSDDMLTLDWKPSVEPMIPNGIDAKLSVAALLHLFNFPDFRSSRRDSSSSARGHSMLRLESDEWAIFLQSLPGDATKRASERINEEGGVFLTHVGKLQRRDGALFTGREALEQRHMLSTFLALVKGGMCSTVCEVGISKEGRRVWEAFSSPVASKPPYSWFNPYAASQAEILFPLFARRWHQSDEWRDCLKTAIYWYTQANTSGGSPGIVAAVILAQSALERLAHHYVVVELMEFSANEFGRFTASERLRLLCRRLSLPDEIDRRTPELVTAARVFGWRDAPHALTDIRNELVHPVSRKKVNTCIVDAWRLSLWYLELSLLSMCGYNGTYTSRLTAEHTTDSETVPWA